MQIFVIADNQLFNLICTDKPIITDFKNISILFNYNFLLTNEHVCIL